MDGVGVDPRQPPLVWEAWTADGWQPCEVRPRRHRRPQPARRGHPARARRPRRCPATAATKRAGCAAGSPNRCPSQPFYTTSPTVRSAEAFTIGGTTAVVHADTVYDEALGESTGLPGQRLRLAHAPVVGDDPPVLAADRRARRLGGLAGGARTSPPPGPDDRHITLDATTGELAFGPAVARARRLPAPVRRGRRPRAPSIRARRYRTGGGRAGNVARGAIRVLRTLHPVRRRGRQPRGRAGRRGRGDGRRRRRCGRPITLRAQERAVTLRDYEELARRAAPETARITCLEGERGRARGVRGTGPGGAAGGARPRRPAALRATGPR